MVRTKTTNLWALRQAGKFRRDVFFNPHLAHLILKKLDLLDIGAMLLVYKDVRFVATAVFLMANDPRLVYAVNNAQLQRRVFEYLDFAASEQIHVGMLRGPAQGDLVGTPREVAYARRRISYELVALASYFESDPRHVPRMWRADQQELRSDLAHHLMELLDVTPADSVLRDTIFVFFRLVYAVAVEIQLPFMWLHLDAHDYGIYIL